MQVKYPKALWSLAVFASLGTSCSQSSYSTQSSASHASGVPAWECAFQTQSWCLLKTSANFRIDDKESATQITISGGYLKRKSFTIIQSGSCSQVHDPSVNGLVSRRLNDNKLDQAMVIQWDLVPGNCSIDVILPIESNGQPNALLEEFAVRAIASCTASGCVGPTLRQAIEKD